MRGDIGRVLWTGVLAIGVTTLVSGAWSGLLLVNLKVSPAIPWAVVIMGLILWALWSGLGGGRGPERTKATRKALLRAGHLPPKVLAWAIIAGVLSIVALAGFWIVLHQLVASGANALPDFSKLPAITVTLTLAMAALAGAVSEEAGFRGYFQGALERCGIGSWAVVVTALVMAPVHTLTQGFV
jgi:membrane protease YdiL (CAAX protease family)